MSTVTTVIDQEALGRLLLDVEAGAHRGGWDGPPSLMIIYDARCSDAGEAYRQVMSDYGHPIRHRNYAARVAVPTEALTGFASHAVFRLACNLTSTHPAAQMMIVQLRQPGFLGLALVCETWCQAMSTEERDALGDKRLADIPGSYEARIVTCGDITGQIRYVQRTRGRKPVLAPPTEDYTGSIPESLRYAAAAIAGLDLPELPSAPSGWGR